MSLPTFGKYDALVDGSPVSFDGREWTAQNWRHKGILAAVSQFGTHLTVASVAEKALESAFPGRWTAVAVDIPAWANGLPEEAED